MDTGVVIIIVMILVATFILVNYIRNLSRPPLKPKEVSLGTARITLYEEGLEFYGPLTTAESLAPKEGLDKIPQLPDGGFKELDPLVERAKGYHIFAQRLPKGKAIIYSTYDLRLCGHKVKKMRPLPFPHYEEDTIITGSGYSLEQSHGWEAVWVAPLKPVPEDFTPLKDEHGSMIPVETYGKLPPLEEAQHIHDVVANYLFFCNSVYIRTWSKAQINQLNKHVAEVEGANLEIRGERNDWFNYAQSLLGGAFPQIITKIPYLEMGIVVCLGAFVGHEVISNLIFSGNVLAGMLVGIIASLLLHWRFLR